MIDEIFHGAIVAWGPNPVFIKGIHEDTVLKEAKEPHVYVDGIGRLHYFPLNISEIAPIELTPDWLIKFGFEKKPLTEWKGNGQDYQPETLKTEQQDYVFGDFLIARYEAMYYRKTEDEGWTGSQNGVSFLYNDGW